MQEPVYGSWTLRRPLRAASEDGFGIGSRYDKGCACVALPIIERDGHLKVTQKWRKARPVVDEEVDSGVC